MAESILGAWWDRIRGKLQPRPCPYFLAPVLEIRGRDLEADPKKVLGAFEPTLGQTVLEIGPGTGFYSVEAALGKTPKPAYAAGTLAGSDARWVRSNDR